MAITDVVAKAIVEFKGDTSDLKAKLRDLQGEEKRLGQAQLGRIEESNKSLEGQIAMLGKMGGYAAAAAAVVAGAFAAMGKAAERQRLEVQAGKVDLDALSASAGRTKTELQLLAETAKIQTGVYKLNQSQLEMVQQAMRQLTRETGNADEVSKKVTESIVKLESGALADYGIRVREAKTDSEKFAAIMDALAAKSGNLTDKNKTSAESMAGLKATFGDAIDELVDGLGKLLLGLTPVLEVLGKIAGVAGAIVAHAGNSIDWMRRTTIGAISNAYDVWTNKNGPQLNLSEQLSPNMQIVGSSEMAGMGRLPAFVDPQSVLDPWGAKAPTAMELQIAWQQLQNQADAKGFEESQQEVKDAAQRELDALEERFAKRDAWLKSPKGLAYIAMLRIGSTMARRQADIEERRATDALVAKLERETAAAQFGGILPSASDEAMLRGISLQRGQEKTLTELWNERMNAIRGVDTGPGAGIRAVQKTQLEQLFGPVEEFDAYAKGFQLLTGASQAAFSAWIDGSMSAGEALKKFFAESLKGMATDLLGKAIVHGAYAIGSLAFGDIRGAAQHGQAAAMAAAGAVALGGLAKALTPSSGGGGGAPDTSRGGNRGASGYVPEERRGDHQIYIVGDPYALDSPRKRAASWRDTAKRVNGASGVAYR